MDELRPDAKQNWLNLTSNDFDELMPLIDKGAKASTKASRERTIFKPYSNGISTACDDWVTDFTADLLRRKGSFSSPSSASTSQARRRWERKKPKDPTIRAMFDTYRFADHKEKVIDLLMRVTTVSAETVRIVAAMKGAGR